MATASSQTLVGINIQFDQKKTTLYVSKKDRVGSVIARAVEELKLDKDKKYALLHEGAVLPPETTAEIAIVPARTTVFFLQLATEKVIRSSVRQVKLEDANNDMKGEKYGYCKSKSCEAVSNLRPILNCAKCGNKTFALSSDCNLDHFDEESVSNARGMCTTCGSECKPRITYFCKVCENRVPFLNLVRDNTFNLPCMKCGKKEDQVFKFACSSQHTLCLKCFDFYCSIMLSRNKFRNFPDGGFSICCPGPGADCPDTPVGDPHHFYIVGDKDAFYHKFSEEAFKEWKPPGDNIICDKCNMEVDLSRGKDVEVPRPAAADEVVVSGSAWFKNIKKIFARPPPPPPPPQTRKKVACFKCQQEFCCVCKKLWHEGDCVIINEEEVKEFSIQQDKAEASCWPHPKSPPPKGGASPWSSS